MILSLGTLQQMEGDEAGNLMQMDFAIEPRALEVARAVFENLEPVHGYVHGIALLLGRIQSISSQSSSNTLAVACRVRPLHPSAPSSQVGKSQSPLSRLRSLRIIVSEHAGGAGLRRSI